MCTGTLRGCGPCLAGAEQDALAASHPGNALLRFRGNAGSHDVGLGVETLRALKRLNDDDGGKEGGGVAVPRYDKTMRGGRGDRAPASAWPTVRAPLDIVLLEVSPGGGGGRGRGIQVVTTVHSLLRLHSGLSSTR